MGTSGTELGRIQSRFEEHRLFLRKRVLQPISIELSPGKKAWLYDLSEGGLRVYGGSGVDLGTSAYIRFQFPEANSVIDASGVVAWSDPSGRAGVRFTHMQPESNASLRRWLESEPDTAESVATATSNDDSVLASRISSLVQVSDLQAEICARQLDRDAALDVIVRRMLEVTRATGAAIALRDGDDDVICRATAGNAPDVGVRLSSTSLSGECFRTGTVVLLSDSETDPRVDPQICRELNFRSLLVMPISTDDEAIGIAEVLSPNPRNFEGGDILVLSFLAEMVVSLAGPTKEAIEPQTQDLTILLSTGEAQTPQEAVAAESLADASIRTELANNGLHISPPSAPILAAEGPGSAPTTEAQVPRVAGRLAVDTPIAIVSEPPVPTAPIQPAAEPAVVARERAVAAAVAGSLIAASSPIEQSPVRVTRISEAGLSTSAASVPAPASQAELRPPVIRLAEPQQPTWTLAVAAAVVGLLVCLGLLFSYQRRSSVTSASPAITASAAAKPAANTAPPPAIAPAPSPAKVAAASKPGLAPGAHQTMAPAKPRANEPGTEELFVLHSATARPVSVPDSPAPEAPKIADVANRGLGALPAGVTLATPKPQLQISQSQGVSPGRLLKRVMPHYPDLALHAGVSGDVVLSATIGTDGLLHNIKALSGSPMLREEAIAAARQWRYAPATLSGKPVESDTRITINFHH